MDGKISAMTGMQTRNFEKEVLKDLLLKTIMDEQNKTLGFVQMRLTSALEVYKYDKHVLAIFADRKFSMYNDNRRSFEEKPCMDNLHDS